MWIKGLAALAVFLFLLRLVAVLQGGSKSTLSGRMTSTIFLLGFGYAALWGMRVLTGTR
jgi:hypothetical protein